MKVLATYTVIEEDDGSIRTYNSLKINAPYPISRACFEWHRRKEPNTEDKEKADPSGKLF